jgi:Fic family protein
MVDLTELLQQLDTLKIELDELRPIARANMDRIVQKLRLDWNYHSNTIEGNSLTLSETRAFILHGITANGKPFRDYVEMRGHNEALKKIEQIVHKDLRITESLIKDIHQMILVEPYRGQNTEINPGQYKKMPNYLYSNTGERIDFEPPEDVPRLMNELINWTNNHLFSDYLNKSSRKKYSLHPVLVASIFHLRFVNIHHFGDGNGRMARIISNLILMIKGYTPAIIQLQNRDDYYHAIGQSDATQINPLAIIFAQSILKTLEISIKGAKGENIDDLDDWQKELTLLQTMLQENNHINGIKQTAAIKLKIYQLCFRALFLDFFRETKIFSSFFENFEQLTLINDSSNTTAVGIDYLDQHIPDYNHYQSIGAACIGSNWKGQSIAQQSFRLDLCIEFQDYFYEIKTKTMSLKKKYTELLSPDEMGQLIAAIGKTGLETIKSTLQL